MAVTIRSSVYIIFNLRSLYSQSLQFLPNWIQLHTSGTSAKCTPFQWIKNKNTFFCYSLPIRQFQLKLFYYGKGCQNFASNVTLYPCERSRQNHQDRRRPAVRNEQKDFLISQGALQLISAGSTGSKCLARDNGNEVLVLANGRGLKIWLIVFKTSKARSSETSIKSSIFGRTPVHVKFKPNCNKKLLFRAAIFILISHQKIGCWTLFEPLEQLNGHDMTQ